MLNIEYFFFNPYMERGMVLWDASGQGVILDPGCLGEEEEQRLFRFITNKGIDIQAILLTHAHFDHIFGVAACVNRYGVKVYMSPQEKVVKEGMRDMAAECGMPLPDTDWKTTDIYDGSIISFGDTKLKVITTPGHSCGSVCYYCEESKDLFSGDTLFSGSVGRTDLRWGNFSDEITSIAKKLMILEDDVRIHPGHGGGSTIGYERSYNPFF